MSGAFVLEEVLREAVARGASDVHLKVPSPPLLRVDGKLERLVGFAALRPTEAQDALAVMLASLPHSAKQAEFDRIGEVDFAYAHPGLGRFRVNAFRQRGSVSILIRLVPFGVPRLDELGLPAAVGSLLAHESGLCLVAGPRGSGVSRTLAALVDALNDAPRSIVTIEDPIELLHVDREAAINQREVGLDTPSIAEGLTNVLHHDPDVVLIGVLGDLATIEMAIAIAEAGVLVLAGRPDQGAVAAIDWIVNQFPGHRQRQARAALAAVLLGVVGQRLVPNATGTGRALAAEFVLGTPTVRTAIIDGASDELMNEIADADTTDGMRSLNESLAGMVAAGLIRPEDALRASRDPIALTARLARQL